LVAFYPFLDIFLSTIFLGSTAFDSYFSGSVSYSATILVSSGYASLLISTFSSVSGSFYSTFLTICFLETGAALTFFTITALATSFLTPVFF